MLDFITKFFKREEASKTLAKERLRLVLMSDRVSLAPDIFDEMKGEMLAVIRRYLEIDERALDMHFENLERQFALLASIPVLKVRTAEEVALASAAARTTTATLYGAAERNGAAQRGGTADRIGTAERNGFVEHGGAAEGNGSVRAPGSRRRRRRRRPSSLPPDTPQPPDSAPEG